jgi:hypothetical protein
MLGVSKQVIMMQFGWYVESHPPPCLHLTMAALGRRQDANCMLR